jgi:lipoprotein LprG
MRRRAALAALLLAATGALAACSDDGGSDPSDALDEARQALDDTPGLRLLLSTDDLPDGVSGVIKADGIGTHQPAWEGEIDVFYSGTEFTVPLVAVDDVVHAQLPFTKTYAEIDPMEYGAPNPAGLMDPDTGISSWLDEAEDVQRGDQVRDGGDVLTSYEGTLAGATVSQSLPSADEEGDFDVVFTVDEDGRLRTVALTGVFYAEHDENTYTLEFTDYGTDKSIKAP